MMGNEEGEFQKKEGWSMTKSVQKSKQPTKLTFMSIYFLGINTIIGSGAFLLPSAIYHDIGLVSILVLVVAALVSGLIAVCYASLASRFSNSGAAWLYAYSAFGRFTGFQVGIYEWFMGCCSIAAETIALVTILRNLFPVFHHPTIFYTTVWILILALAIINLFGTSIVKWMDNLSSIAKVAVMLFVIVVGIFFVKFAHLTPIVPASASTVPSFTKHFGDAFSVVFYMFSGFSFIPVAAGKMENPTKNIPKALFWVMISVTLLYVFMQFVTVGILGTSTSKFDIPVANALATVLGKIGYYIVILGILISIFGVAFSISFNTPVLASALATDHHLFPKFFGKQNKYSAPYVAIIISTIVALALTRFSYLFLVSAIVLTSFIQYIASVLALIKFQHNGTFPSTGFKLRGKYLFPILALVASAYLLLNVKMSVFITALIVFAVGSAVYFFRLKEDEHKQKKEDEKMHA